jgi:hypothetical protein
MRTGFHARLFMLSLLTLAGVSCQDAVRPTQEDGPPTQPWLSTGSPTSSGPAIVAVAGPDAPVAVGVEVIVTVTFADPDPGDTHSAEFRWGDGASSDATIGGSGSSRTASATHVYQAPGVYAVEGRVVDAQGGATDFRHEYITVFDPHGGSVSGNGAIASPAGACTWDGCAADGSTVGTATFGFSSKYKRGAHVPSGNTRFHFRDGNLTFASTHYEWLVVAGARAQFKGTGTINRTGSYGFLLTAVDGSQPGGGGVDRFRIRIWDAATEEVLYDNERGVSDDATPTTGLLRGRIAIRTTEQNTAPSVMITSPANGASFSQGSHIDFAAYASDLEDGDVSASLLWSSDLDGIFGAGQLVTASLSSGTHRITAKATDSEGLSGSAAVSITVTANAPPTVEITSPADGVLFQEGETLTLAGTAYDSDAGDVSSTIAWSSSVDGKLGTGAVLTEVSLSAGNHTVTASATGAGGVAGSASIAVRVNAAPTVAVTAPDDGIAADQGQAVTFSANVTDAEDGSLSGAAIVWTSDLAGVIGTGTSFQRADLSVGTHRIEVVATDADGGAGSAALTLTIVNAAPVVTITAPADGSSFEHGQEIVFAATAADAGTNISGAIRWESSEDGPLGSGASISTTSLTAGLHTISASVTDPDDPAVTVSARISLNIEQRDAFGSNLPGTLSGQGAIVQLHFDGESGDIINVAMVSDAMCGRAYVRLRAPDGSQIVQGMTAGYSCRMYGETGVRALTATGRYTIEIEGIDSGSSGPFEVGLSKIAEPAPFGTGAEINDQHGKISTYGERHYYRLSASQYQVVNFLITTSDSLAAYLRIRRPGETPFYSRTQLHDVRTTHSTANAETDRFSFPQTGDYIIEIDPRGVSGVGMTTHLGDYRIRLFTPTAGPVGFDTETEGTVATPYGIDRYTFNSVPGEAVVVRTLNTVSASYLYSELYSATDNRLASDRSQYAWGIAGVSELGPRLLPEGSYFVEQNPTAAGTGPYRFAVVRIAPPAEITSAIPWRLLEDEIDIAGRRRYYAFQGVAGQVASVDVIVPDGSTLQGSVRMYREGADFITGITLSDPVYHSASAEIIPGRPTGFTAVLPQTGRYIIEVNGALGHTGGTGAYQLRFNLLEPAVTVTVGTDLVTCPDASTGIIRAAVRAAGTQVKLCEDVFTETRTVEVTTPGLTIAGAGAEQTYITTSILQVFSVRAADVTLRDLAVGVPPLYSVGAGTAIHGTAAAQRLTVQDCRIVADRRADATRHRDTGISVGNGSHDVVVQRCALQLVGESTSQTFAIRIDGDRARVSDNVINTEAGTGTYYGISLSGASARVADNLIGDDDNGGGAGYAMRTTGEGAVVERNRVLSYSYGLFAQGNSSASPAQALTVRNNEFGFRTGNIGGNSAAMNIRDIVTALVEGNHVRGHPGTNGIVLQGAGGRVVNNRIAISSSRVGIVGQMSQAHPLEIINNTINNQLADGIHLSGTSLTEYPVVIYNNLVWSTALSTSRCALRFDRPVQAANHNLAGNYTTGYCGAAVAGPDDVSSNPLFADAMLRLGAGSPAIDAGTAERAPAVDFEGTPRPQGAGHDIGAHERRSQLD